MKRNYRTADSDSRQPAAEDAAGESPGIGGLAPVEVPVGFFDRILAPLAARKLWVSYVLKPKIDKDGNEKQDKVPHNGRHGLSTKNPNHWMTLAEAIRICEDNKLDGVGIVLTNPIEIDGKRFVGLDYDDVAHDFKPPFRGYAELSPSGNGVHQYAWIDAQWLAGKADNMKTTFPGTGRGELYVGSSRARFLTLTGKALNTEDIPTLDAGEFKLLEKHLKSAEDDDSSEIEFEEGEGKLIDLLSCGIHWSPEQLKTIRGEGGVNRSDFIHSIIIKLANAGKSQADIFATLLRHAPFWQYCLSHRHDDPVRAAQFARDEITRAFAKTVAGAQARANAAVKQWQQQNPGALSASGQQSQAANDAPAAPVLRGHGVKLKTLAEVVAGAGPIDWLIRDFLEASTLAVAYGEPESFKTFLAIAVAIAVASGHDFFGRKVVRKGPVVFIFGEGWKNAGRRLKAICLEWGLDPATLPIVFSGVIGLTTDESVAALQAAVAELPEPPVLYIIDTLARNFGPGDENSTKDMTKAIASADALRGDDATVLVIHHTGKDAKGGMRGSSALPGAIDAKYYVEHDANTKTVTVINEKMKDAEKPLALRLAPKVVELPFKDDEGVAATSVVLEPAAVQGILRVVEFYKAYPKLVERKRGERLGPVLKRINEQPDISINGLAKAIGVAPDTAAGFAKALREAGLIEQDGLRLTAKGQQIAAPFLDPAGYTEWTGYLRSRNGPNASRIGRNKKRG